VLYLSGEPPQGSVGVGYASLSDLPPPASEPVLTITQLDAALGEMAAIRGPGSAAGRAAAISALFARATAGEQRFVSALLVGGLRQGANERMVMDAVARAFGRKAALVRRATMFCGDLGVVAVAAAAGEDSLAAIGLEVFRPVQPMLAKTAKDVAAAVAAQGTASVEWKLDGVRIQLHKSGDEVRLYTRNLNEVTERLPEVVAAAAGLAADTLVLDGEAIAVRPDGRPFPFQVTMGRFGSEAGVDVSGVELSPFLFDVLHVDGEDVLDLPTSRRLELLAKILPTGMQVPRLITEDADAAARFLEEALAAGHEGVMVKSLEAPYAAGRRGAAWLKVKPAHTLDLVVLAAEWGSGRRKGWLSNIHLGARAGDGSFVMLGKTFKGMTDEMLRWQTERFLELETHRKGHVVYVRPEQVVEVAFDGIQDSSRYPGGMALRFARVKGYRHDKGPAEADTIETVRSRFEAQG
jgi:DNA ligase-1